MIFLALMLGSLAPAPRCQYIAADRIYARDLAAVAPAFATVPPDVPLGYSPAPGQTKTFRASELQRMAKSAGAELAGAPDVCFEWKMRTLTAADLLPSMQAALEPRHAKIEIVEVSRFAAPEGPVVFSDPPTAVADSAATPRLWRGYIAYAPNRRFLIWARVLLTASGSRLVASEALKPGLPIRTDQLRTESYTGPLTQIDELTAPEDAIGHAVKFIVPAGAVLRRAMLTRAADVLQGELVEVRVASPRSVIVTEAIAQQAGILGEFISVKNPSSGKTFRARVDGKDRVSVIRNDSQTGS